MNEFEIAKKLRDCLLQLVEGKATERKKQVENLKVYLTHPAYLQHLNKSSLKGRNASEAGIVYISWQKVFSKIKDYIEQECQRLKDRERSSETLSATVRENICKERRLCLSLFRCFTKALTISEQYEMAHPLMLHILAVLHEYYTELTFRNEYSNVLLKCILNDPFMCLKIPAEKFDDAIWIYCKIIKKFSRSNDRGISSQVLHDLLAVRYNMGHTDASKILSFFTHMFQTLKSEKASLFHENLLRCLLVVSKALGSDYHIRLCELGESILLPLLDLWKTRPSETCQELMLEFISLQLSLHHPKGAVKQENGARAADWQTWKNHLLSLYKVILVEVTELCETNKYSARYESKESILKPIFVFVAVEVCAQIFPGSVDCLDITQASTSYEVSQPAKKRRVEVCFRALTDDLTSSKIEPWLQVISSFLVNHSDIVSMQDAEHLLDILIDIHLSCNQLETKRWLLTCCQSFVQAFGSKDAGDCSEGGFQWQRLWELAVKSVALMHQCQEAGHKLLTALLFYKLAVPKAEFYTLYAPGSSNPVTSASLRSLKTFLEKYPASYTAHSMYYNNSVSSMGNGTFENQIMEWLFSRKNDDNSPFQVLSNDDMPTLEAFAEVAALLCLRNNGSHCSLEVSSEKLEKIQWIQLMEEELLLITFDMPFNHNMSNQGTTSFNSSPGQLLQPVWDKILNRFISATEGIFEEQISNFQNASLSTFLRYACLLFEMLQTFYFQGIIKEEHLQSNHFTSYLKKSLHAFIEISKKRENNLLSDETNQIKGLLQRILMVFKKHCQQTVPVQYPNNFIVTVANSVPVEMLTYLLSYSLENVNHNTSTLDVSNDFSEPEGNLNHSLRKNKYAFAEDDLEDEVDSFVPRMENKESVQLMDVKGLPNNVQQQLECLEILGEFSSFIDSDTYFDELASFPQNMIQQMLSFISRNDQGFRRVADVHLVLKSLRCILLNKQLADEVIDKVLSTLKLILNQLGKMQDLCQAVLELFPLLYPHIFKDSSNMSSNRVRSKFHMLHLLRVLCKRESEQKGSRFTSCLMTQNLLAIINMEPSSLWSSESSSSTSHDSCIATNSDSVAYAFIKFLNSPFISVRLLVAKNINVSVTGIIIDDIFESVCNEIFTYLQRENQSRASSENNEEEISNRIRTFLHFLGHIIVYFPCLEMESIYMMCKLVKIKKVDESLAAKVVQQISSILGYRSMRDLVESHLVNILHKWIKDKYSWKEFPFILLDVESIESFILDFFKFLVPVLFYYGDNESISELSNKLNLSLAEVIYACYPTIQARILSGCAVDYRRRDALKCRNFLSNYLPQELQEKVFPAKLDELVVSLLSLLKENGNAHLKLCETHIECISCQDFCSAVKNMMSDISCDGTFSSFLCQRVDHIQNIFLSLNIMLSKAVRPHEGRRVLCMYQSFLELLLPCLNNKFSCSLYVIKEIIFSMINFLTDEKKSAVKDDSSIIYCVDLLFLLCKTVLPSFREVIGGFLPFIVSSLNSFVKDCESGKKVFSFLSYLINDNEDHLAEYLPYVDPFPSNELFCPLARKQNKVKYRNGKLTLEQEIDIFLKSCKMMGKGTLEGLNQLCSELNSRREELADMVNILKSKTLFSEDVKKSILHQLVCQLSSLCAPGKSAVDVQIAASRCLGAIGPIAFSSVVLQPFSHDTIGGLNALQQSYTVILNILTEYLFDKSIDIKITASQVLKDLLGTRIGYTFYLDYKLHHPDNNIERYAYPFFACQNTKSLKRTCQYSPCLNNIQRLSVWLPIGYEHSEWITNLVCTIIESGLTGNNFFECLIPICKKQVSFCEKILPYLIHVVLLLDDEHIRGALSTGIQSFFSHFSSWVQSSSSKSSQLSASPSNKEFSKSSVQTMLSVLNHIWLNPREQTGNQRNVLKDFWLDLNYLEVAQAAQYCSAYFTAILYTELWCDTMREKSRIKDQLSDYSDSGSLESSPLSFIGSRDREKASLVYDILLDAYSSIGDMDAVSGCEVVATDSQSILKHSYLIEKKWDGLLKINDQNNSHIEILQALQQNGLHSVLQGYIQSLLLNGNPAEMSTILDYQCESAWRLGHWNLPLMESPQDGFEEHGFQEYLYKSQQNFIAENKPVFDKYLNLARETQFECLSSTSLESPRNILPVLSHIQMLSVLEEFSEAYLDAQALKNLLNKWQFQDQIAYDDFEYVEPVSWLKCRLLTHCVCSNQNKPTILPKLKKLLEKHAVIARKELFLEVASSAVNALRKLPCVEDDDIVRWQIEEAKILWTKKEYSIASKILKSTLHRMEKIAKENSNILMCYGEALTLRGRWLAETCNENSVVIMQEYLEKAVNVLKDIESDNSSTSTSSSCAIWDAYFAVARYADRQYQSIMNYKKSTAYQMKQELLHSSKEEARKLKSKDNNEDQRKTHVIMTKQILIDQEEMAALEADQKKFLEKAIINYLKCLCGTDTHDVWIFRLISLWFENLSHKEINQIISDKIKDLQSYKFLPLMYQLAARMGTQASALFTNTLTQLIKRITIDHPHHALPVILALSNADKDPLDAKKISTQTALLEQAEVPSVKERMNAAKKIISLLQRSKINSILKSYSDLCDAYISLAYLPVDKITKKSKIPADQSLLKFKNLHNIPIITEEVKVDHSCEYKNIVGIYSFHNEFRMCGGLTLPKVIKCIGMDGRTREQLVKGRDDLRQDAVMQQVFCLVNCLLERKMETKRRKLRIRTYKVVPVSRRSGVLQWCEGTQVLSQYLVGGSGGAHARYYPNMATHRECRSKMAEIASISHLPQKREVYDSICANFPPVFRYFFLEHFPEPSSWFERQQSYTKSVAASSIVGYILGLGDRHVNNILIDTNTAEVVHIDFGIAFEKGRILTTPETVPFRLTRDIVDGMGINGVEGTFKRCSEKTLEVMRNSQDVLLTILEVLLYDPLYEWTVPASKSPSQKASSSTTSESQEVNKLAERALMRLQQKLQGLEEGVAMSTEGQVNLLIQQARDPNNLCRLYVGWQPYL